MKFFSFASQKRHFRVGTIFHSTNICSLSGEKTNGSETDFQLSHSFRWFQKL
jgi:hypothetical protein